MRAQNTTTIEKFELLSRFISLVTSDRRLKPTHVSLYVALCDAWASSQFADAFNVSRRKLMYAAHIRSIATYHKVMRSLGTIGMKTRSSL